MIITNKSNYKTLLACFFVLFFSTLHGQQVGVHDMDADAAYRIWLDKRDTDYTAAFNSLVTAARFDHADACLVLARLKWPKEFDYSFFGKSKTLAKIKLLEHAPKDDARAWWQIGNLYAELGQQDKPYLVSARNCYKIAAYGMFIDSWKDYADSCYDGEFDLKEAYLFYCAATFVYDPDSVGGEIVWSKRKEIAKKIGAARSLEILDELKLLFDKKGFPGLALASPALDAEDENLIHKLIDRINKLQTDDRKLLMESARISTP
jgi:hypothetical protein